MKKFFVILLAALMVVPMFATACTKVSKEALADTTHESWVAHGQFLLADGTENGWNGKDAAVYEKSALTAISMFDLKAIDENLYKTLSEKGV